MLTCDCTTTVKPLCFIYSCIFNVFMTSFCVHMEFEVSCFSGDHSVAQYKNWYVMSHKCKNLPRLAALVLHASWQHNCSVSLPASVLHVIDIMPTASLFCISSVNVLEFYLSWHKNHASSDNGFTYYIERFRVCMGIVRNR